MRSINILMELNGILNSSVDLKCHTISYFKLI
jgi:hypothetical protein